MEPRILFLKPKSTENVQHQQKGSSLVYLNSTQDHPSTTTTCKHGKYLNNFTLYPVIIKILCVTTNNCDYLMFYNLISQNPLLHFSAL